MKRAMLLIGVFFLAAFMLPNVVREKALSAKATIPGSGEFSGLIYADGSFSGGGSLKLNGMGKPTKVNLYDMSFSKEENFVQLCIGTTEDDAICSNFQYNEGVSTQTSSWLGGEGEFTVEIHTFKP